MDYFDYPTPPSQLLCPEIRSQNMDCHFPWMHLGNVSYPIINNSCYLSDARADDKKSSHIHQLNLLLWCNNKEDKQNDFNCAACWQNTIGTIYYYCNGCNKKYHKECVESPPVFISPYHPKYPLQLLQFLSKRECHSCGKQTNNFVYYSSICDLILHTICANKRFFPAINNKKRHEHTLHYFPRKASLNCDVCGSDDNKVCFYICHQCNFVVHITCVDLPHVIQISRHNHRLYFTPSLSSQKQLCGVCRQKINGNYGEYSCSKDCLYAVHCKCATRPDVWDGRELEDQPENVDDNIKSFEEISDGIIRHFSHPHHNMRFDEAIGKSYYEKKHCEACSLPLDYGSIYRCLQCDFVLHETCANLPRIKQNMVHAHQFILQPGNSKSVFFCKSCHRYSYGFRYNCSKRCNFSLDIRCASLSEPIHHQSHPHPVFLLYTRRVKEPCLICGKLSYLLLNCVQCVFAVCFWCVTLPYKVKHNDDEHFLTLSYAKNESFLYWCEVCEEKIDPEKGYYTCDECGTIIHIQCTVGNDPYMKPGQLTGYFGDKTDIVPNNRLIRPICNHCQKHCQYKIVFKKYGKIFCSYSEILEGPMRRLLRTESWVYKYGD